MVSCKAESMPTLVDTQSSPREGLGWGSVPFSGGAVHTSTQLLLLDCFPGRTDGKSEQMAQLGLLGRKVARVLGVGRRDERHALDNSEPIPVECREFRGIVAHQSDRRQPKARQNLRAHVIATGVDG